MTSSSFLVDERLLSQFEAAGLVAHSAEKTSAGEKYRASRLPFSSDERIA
jgi:hypothetical protein